MGEPGKWYEREREKVPAVVGPRPQEMQGSRRNEGVKSTPGEGRKLRANSVAWGELEGKGPGEEVTTRKWMGPGQRGPPAPARETGSPGGEGHGRVF